MEKNSSHMAFHFIRDYKNDPLYRLSFNQLAGKTFGIDFERWYQLGFWNDRYICYSFTQANRVVANVSANRMEIIRQGKRMSAVQIGTVMTDPEYRGRGLAAKLMNIVLEEYEDQWDLIYLFANPTVQNFYPQFGFRSSIKECRFFAKIRLNGRYPGNYRKLNLQQKGDLKLLVEKVNGRATISDIFDVERGESILLWHCLYNFPQDIYYLNDLGVLAIAELTDDTLHLYDVIGPEKADFIPIFQRIASVGVENVFFYFTPDFKDIPVMSASYEPEDYTFFVRSGDISLKGGFFYPVTAHA